MTNHGTIFDYTASYVRNSSNSDRKNKVIETLIKKRGRVFKGIWWEGRKRGGGCGGDKRVLVVIVVRTEPLYCVVVRELEVPVVVVIVAVVVPVVVIVIVCGSKVKERPCVVNIVR